jgi:hypothetical protein
MGGANGGTSEFASGWDFIDSAVKLFRRGGNAYGFAIGAKYQKWCRETKRDDASKGLTRNRGVRENAWAQNAKILLQMSLNDIAAFWEWLEQQKSRADGDDNRLVKAVKAGFRDERMIAHLWLTAIVSDGYFQPLMYAINENDDDKDMIAMRPVVTQIRRRLQSWAKGEDLHSLVFGWCVGHFGTPSAYTVPADDVIAAMAVDWLGGDEEATRSAVTEYSPQLQWNVQKYRNAQKYEKELRCVVQALLTSFEHFVEEYQPSGVFAVDRPLSADVIRVGSVSPTNNDHNERSFGLYDHLNRIAVNMLTPHKEARLLARQNHTIEWAHGLTPDQLRTNLAVARAYRTKMKAELESRRLRDAGLSQQITQRTIEDTKRRRAKREQTEKENAARQLWTSESEVHAQIAAAKSETGRLSLLKGQLSSFKQRFKLKASETAFSVDGKKRTSAELSTLLIDLIHKHKPVPTAAAAASSSSASATAAAAATAAATASSSSSSAAATPAAPPNQPKPKPKPKPKSKRPREPQREVLTCCDELERENDLCVQCSECRSWRHCACEGVSWEEAQWCDEFVCSECAQYLC